MFNDNARAHTQTHALTCTQTGEIIRKEKGGKKKKKEKKKKKKDEEEKTQTR